MQILNCELYLCSEIESCSEVVCTYDHPNGQQAFDPRGWEFHSLILLFDVLYLGLGRWCKPSPLN